MAETTDVVRALYEAFARGDVDTVLGSLDDTVQWKEAEGSPLAHGNPYVGPQAVAEGVFQPLVQDLENFAVTPHSFVGDDSQVVALGRYTGSHKATQQPLNAQFAHHWRLRDGKVVAFQQYTDTGQWRRVYGEG